MTPKKPVTTRLWAYLARDASIGVILRRGPGDWVQMIHWDTKNDIFTPGHWMKGRVWERRSDLSPDGQLLIYAYHKPHNVLYNPERFPTKDEYGGGWMAVSKPPYFTALALWPHNIGGGFFVDNGTLYIGNVAYDTEAVAHPEHEPQGLSIISFGYFPNAIVTHWFERNRWIRIAVQRKAIVHEHQPYWTNSPFDMWRKDVDNFGFSLYVKDMTNSLFYSQKPSKRVGRRSDDYLEYGVIDRHTNQEAILKGVVWADFDQQKRLVLAKEGKLFSAAVVDGELTYTELADFNANQPEAIESPDWAKKW